MISKIEIDMLAIQNLSKLITFFPDIGALRQLATMYASV
jgi:hypothetical protein